MTVDHKRVVSEIVAELVAHYPQSNFGEENYTALIVGLCDFPEWAVRRVAKEWAATSSYPPRSVRDVAVKCLTLVRANQPQQSGGCDLCDHEWVWVDDSSVRPCMSCKPVQYDAWRAGRYEHDDHGAKFRDPNRVDA